MDRHVKSLQNKEKVLPCLGEEFTKGAVWGGHWTRSPYFSKQRRGFQAEGAVCPSGLLFDSSGPRTMPEHHRLWIKVTEGRREFRAWTDRLPFRREAMIRGVNGQVLIAKRFFPVVWRGGLNWLVQGSIRMPHKRMVDISEGQGRPGYAAS